MPDTQANLSFLPWVRQGVAAGLSTADNLGAAQAGMASVEFTLTLNAEPPLTVVSQLRGPADVTGIDVHQVIRMEPRPYSTDFEPNHFASVEFDRPDFPWLFTPLKPGDRSRLRPWLCLVVVMRRDGVSLTPPGTGPLPELHIGGTASPADELPDLADAWAWAHAQAATGASTREAVSGALNGGSELSLSRLLCSRRLQANTDYFACVVPTFEVGRKAGLGLPVTSSDLTAANGSLAPAWSLTPQPPTDVVLPVYHSWSFRTGAEGDFEALARRLIPRLPPDGLGMRAVEIAHPGFALPAGFPMSVLVDVPGALQPVDAPDAPPPLPPDIAPPFQTALATIVNAPGRLEAADPAADPLLAPPLYGRWYAARTIATPSASVWFDTLNLDPRWRSIAALGVRVVQEHQEALMASAWQQAADLRAANQRLRLLQLSLAVGSNVHARHLKPLQMDAVLRFAAPVFGRIRAPLGTDPQPRTLIAQMTRSAAPFAAVSVAMRRIGRGRGPMTRRVASEAVARVAGGNWISILNHGLVVLPPPPATGPATIRAVLARIGGSPGIRGYAEVTADLVAATAPRPLFAVVAEGQPVRVVAPPPRLPHQPPFADSESAKAFRQAAVAHLTRLNPGRMAIMVGPPAPLDVDGVRAAVLGHLDPRVTLTALAKAVIASGPAATTPADTPASMHVGLDIVMAAPRFPQPMYEPLRDLSQDLLLPGLDAVPPDTVLGLKTNRPFVEAYMVGLNGEMNGELLWRGFPTDQRATCFDQFWDVRGAGPGHADIAPLITWGDNALGHSPAVPATDADRFVMLVRSALLQRYPNAVIYAARAIRTARGREISEAPADEIYPIFTGSMLPDVAFFGFNLPAAAVTGADGSEGCYVIIQEHPTEPRFGLDAGAPAGRISALGNAPDGTALRGLSWGRNGAHMAGITRRLPARVAIHGSRLTPPARPPL
ncbi:hypothetical protein MWN34_14495 [Ancylobacter sp. 6x-1]|uniref:Baseplate protein J-like domain-containing protein n=1 Tax=Ancylobacter crimeensis TaxID=2579147 RepID=A0ABT0DDS5_9HYPH|nr:hypothetical protein [Ancylobacter crimeensis]MCK0198120.1 hypothetical protein [Ancylobacter crimeensis]